MASEPSWHLPTRQFLWLILLALLSLALTVSKFISANATDNDTQVRHNPYFTIDVFNSPINLPEERLPHLVYGTLFGLCLSTFICLCFRKRWALALSLPFLLLAMTINAVWVWIVRQLVQMAGAYENVEPDLLSVLLQLSLSIWFLAVVFIAFKEAISRRRNQPSLPNER